ncbi:unnamed protein product [Echinostoma caproni]|uniref:CARP motif domain-containing protein n=1 Tax=Echinostoma caproni TaxID=27848 RepID=A0A3P8FCN5_9TREM|nr:unnamed protein product [Echinostoma caproni]
MPPALGSRSPFFPAPDACWLLLTPLFTKLRFALQSGVHWSFFCLSYSSFRSFIRARYVVPPVSQGDDGESGRNALFAAINRGEAITSGLRKVTDDMKTHKNPALRAAQTTPIKPPKPTQQQTETQNRTPSAPAKGVLELRENKWKTGVVFEHLISSLDVVNCQSVQVQSMGQLATVNIDKTDGCQVYLSADSKFANVITAKSSEINMLIPKDDGEFVSYFRTSLIAAKLIMHTR